MSRYGPFRAGRGVTARHAKAQLNGTFRHDLSSAVTAVRRLITRRSQVQILPPPPSKTLVNSGPPGPLLLFRRSPLGVFLADLLATLRDDVAERRAENPIAPHVLEAREVR